MNIVKNDRVYLIKEMGDLKMVGEAFEVANITDTSIVLRTADKKIAICAVYINEFDKYFKKAEEFTGWTEWHELVDPNENIIAVYRTNYRKVQVRLFNGVNKFRGEAFCNRGDNFNLFFGIQLAYARCMSKFYKDEIEETEAYLKEIKSTMTDNKNSIKRMINNYYKDEV
jgi:hypothetical protein